MVHKAVPFALAALLAISAGAAFAAGSSEISLLGKDPGKAAAYACFTRHYDAAHLAAHPRQNVRNISAFVESALNGDADDPDAQRNNGMTIGFNLRGFKQQFEASGSCSADVDGQHILSCGIDCDGGHFDVTTLGQSKIKLAIPDSIAMWDPTMTGADDPNPMPKGAAFGDDDKLFQLERVDNKQCLSLMSGEARLVLYNTPLPPEPADGGDAANTAAGAAQ